MVRYSISCILIYFLPLLWGNKLLSFYPFLIHLSYFLMYDIIRTSWQEYSRIKVKAWLKSQVGRVAKKRKSFFVYFLSEKEKTFNFLLISFVYFVHLIIWLETKPFKKIFRSKWLEKINDPYINKLHICFIFHLYIISFYNLLLRSHQRIYFCTSVLLLFVQI